MWRDGGRYRGEGLEIFLLGIPRDKFAATDFPYEAPAAGKVIEPCRERRVVMTRATNKRLQRTRH